MLGNANGVFKVRTVKRRSPSQQWNASYVIQMTSTPWQPRGDGVESTAFVMGSWSERPSEASSWIGA